MHKHGSTNVVTRSIQRLLLLSLFAITGCLSNHRHFNIYKTAPDRHAGKDFPIHGVYFLVDAAKGRTYYGPSLSIFLYDDGTVKTYNIRSMSTVPENEFWQKPDEYLKNVKFNAAGGDGVFQIQDGKIEIEIIDFKGGIPQQGANRFEGNIGNDSTIQLITQICKWCPARITGYPKGGVRSLEGVEYRFYQTEVRPDSSDSWIRRTHWYKKGRNKLSK